MAFWPFQKKQAPDAVPLEAQLRVFADCGFLLNDGISKEMLAADFSSDDIPRAYLQLAISLGSDEPSLDDFRPRCLSLWHFDTEYIDDPSSYKNIAQRMSLMSRAQLPLTDIRSHASWEDAGDPTTKAWLEFKLKDKHYHWDFRVEDDWVDPSVFTRCAQLTAEHRTLGKYIYLDLKGQDCLIGYASLDELARLRKKTDLDFQLLS